MSAVGRYTGNRRSAIIVIVEAPSNTQTSKDQLIDLGLSSIQIRELLGGYV
jgi:hypothetical protein